MSRTCNNRWRFETSFHFDRTFQWAVALVACSGGCMTAAYHPPAPTQPASQLSPSKQSAAKTAESKPNDSAIQTVSAKPPTEPPAAKLDVPTFPIDLPTALRLGDANNLDIALARNRYAAAYQDQRAAGLLWLPNIQVGDTYLYHDGMIQRAVGQIIETRRASNFIGGGPVMKVDVADALYEPLVARQVANARAAGAAATANDSLRQIAEGYLDLLDSYVRLAISRETRDNSSRLAQLTESFARTGVGLPSDAARAQTEVLTAEQDIVNIEESGIKQSTALARLLRLDPRVQLDPIETMMVPVQLLPSTEPIDALVELALRTRPELAENRSLVQAAVSRVRQAKIGPLMPSVQLGFQSGTFGGGYSGNPDGGFFGTWGGREDFTAALVWELKSLGLGNVAETRRRQTDADAARIKLAQTIDRVVYEVVTARKVTETRARQLEIARKAVEAAIQSLELNENRIRGGNGLPIELLQSIQALDKARKNYLLAVTSFNKAQFALYAAVGTSPLAALDSPNIARRMPQTP